MLDNTGGDGVTVLWVLSVTDKHKIRKDEENFYSFVLNDTMGFEKLPDGGVHVEDVKLALRGHVRDGYQVQSSEL